MSTPELTGGSDVALAENREIEQDSKLDKIVVADHVWSTCRPSPKFSSSMPTVTARRIQIVRLQLQNNPRLKDSFDADAGAGEEGEDADEVGELGATRGSGSPSIKKGDSERSFPCSTESDATANGWGGKKKSRGGTSSGRSSGRSSPKKVCDKGSGTSVDEGGASEAPSAESAECYEMDGAEYEDEAAAAEEEDDDYDDDECYDEDEEEMMGDEEYDYYCEDEGDDDDDDDRRDGNREDAECDDSDEYDDDEENQEEDCEEQ